MMIPVAALVLIGLWCVYELGWDYELSSALRSIRHEIAMRQILLRYWLRDRSEPFPPLFGSAYDEYVDRLCDTGSKLMQERQWWVKR